MKRKDIKAFLAMLAALALCISQIGITTAVRAEEGGTGGTESEGPTTYIVKENTTLNSNVDVDNVLITSGAALTIVKGGYLAANKSFVVEEGAKIVTELDYPVIEIREGVNNVKGFDRYVWNDQLRKFEPYTGTGEAYVYQYMNIENESGTDMGWVRQDIMGPGPLDWFGLEETAYNKELQVDWTTPVSHGSIAVSKINGEAYSKVLAEQDPKTGEFDPEANTAEFSDKWCNQTRLHMVNGSGETTATVEFALSFVDSNQNFNFDMFDYYTEGDERSFHVDRWMLEDPESEYIFGTPIEGTPIEAYSPAEGGLSATLTIRLTNEHTDIAFGLCTGTEPGVCIRFNDENLSSTVVDTWLNSDSAVTGLKFIEQTGNEYRYSFTDGAGSYSVNFSGLSKVANYKGFIYRITTSEWENPDKNHVSNAASLSLDTRYYYDIELYVSEEAPIYDNTYRAFVSGSVSEGEGYTFKINNVSVTNNETTEYTGDTLTLSYTLPEGENGAPYVIMRYEMSPTEDKVQFSGNTATVTTDGYPVSFEIYRSEAEYRFNKLPCDWSTETQIEYFAGENGTITLTRGGSPLSGARVDYNGWTRIVVDKEGSPVHFEITASEGYKIDIQHFDMRYNTETGDEQFDVYGDTTHIANLSISEDATTASGDWNVTELNSLRVEFTASGGGQGEEPGGQGEEPGGQGEEPGGHEEHGSPTVESAKEAIESYLIAYAPASSGKTVQELAKNELWNVFFGTIRDGSDNVRHVGDFAAFFANRDAFESAISIGEATNSESAITNLSYYPFTLTIPVEGAEPITASGKIYILTSEYDMVVRSTKNSDSYQVITATPIDPEHPENGGYSPWDPYRLSCAYDIDSDGMPMIEVFGNGGSFINISDSGNRAQCFGGHITGEQAGFDDCKLSFKLEIYNSSFTGVKVSGNGDDTEDGGQGLAAAWSWFEMDTIATNGTTASNPVAYNIFVGNTKIYLDSVSTLGSKKKITGVTCSLPAAERAVRITQSGDRFIVEPLSTFYTVLPLAVTYEGGVTGYITINIVAMDIQDKTSPGGSNSIIINHGTDRDYSFDCPDRNAITATFYYTKDIDPATTGVSAILEATYTWKDGSVTRNTITEKVNRESWAGTSEPEKVTADDFILWQGSADNKPVKIEVIALKPDSVADTFAGALFGGGAGITWTKD